nr:MAG TPA: hypothetical protein [Caudoviricetes sp.]
MKTINLEQLDILFKNKPDNINVFLGQNWNSDLFLKVSNSKLKNKSKFFKFNRNEKNFNYVPYDIDEYSHLRKHNNLNSFIKEFLVLIKNNISDNNASIYNSNKNLEKYNLYKNVMLTGKYNEKLSQRYALQTFDKLVECDSCYIDKLEIIIYMDIKNNYYQYKENESFKKFTFKELKENYIKYIDKSILDYNRILDNQSRIKLDYDSILDALRSIYSEFFI